MKVVINTLEGGFNLSNEAIECLLSKGWKLAKDGGQIEENKSGIMQSIKYFLPNKDTNEFRSHPDVIEVVERLQEKSWGHAAELKIVEIPDDIKWKIQETEYGQECVAEEYRTWD